MIYEGPARNLEKPAHILAYYFKTPPYILMPSVYPPAGQIIRVEGISGTCYVGTDAKTLYFEPEDDIKAIWERLVAEYARESDDFSFIAKNGERYVRDGDAVIYVNDGREWGMVFDTIDEAINCVTVLLTVNFTPALDKPFLTNQELAQITEAENAALTKVYRESKSILWSHLDRAYNSTTRDEQPQIYSDPKSAASNLEETVVADQKSGLSNLADDSETDGN